MIDLHMHSTFSDGSYNPEELVDLGRKAGLTAMALTDHDCTDGVPRFLAACEAAGIRGIPGVEISADVKKGTMHILGYFVDPANRGLEDTLVQIRSGREDRNQVILKKLNELGVALTWDEVAAFAGEDVVGRPHFAQAMLKRGYIKDKDEAFDRYLGKGKPAYFERFRLPPEASIKVIREAGGLPVLSHPFTMEMGQKDLRAFVGDMKQHGLAGVEVYYSEHSVDQIRLYESIVKEHGLVATGGTDFHGQLNPDIRLGAGFGGLVIPDSVLVALDQALAAR